MAFIQISPPPEMLSAMAGSGQGSVEWSTTVKPILTAIYGPFFDKNDAVEIIQAILKRFVLCPIFNSADYKVFVLLFLTRSI